MNIIIAIRSNIVEFFGCLKNISHERKKESKGEPMFDQRHLFNGSIIAAITAVAIFAWLKVYKSLKQDLKRGFIIEASVIFSVLFVLAYKFTSPYYYDYEATALESFYYKFSTVLVAACLAFLPYLIAKYLYIKIPSDKKSRLLCEYAIVACICAFFFYKSANQNSAISPEDLKLLANTDDLKDYFGEPSQLQNIARLIPKMFSITSIYAIVRNWICLKMLKLSDK